MVNKKLAILIVLVMLTPLIITACGPTPEPVVVIETVPVEVTRVIKEEGEERTVVETVIVEVAKEVTPLPPTEVPPTPVPELQETDTVVIAHAAGARIAPSPDRLHDGPDPGAGPDSSGLHGPE